MLLFILNKMKNSFIEEYGLFVVLIEINRMRF